MKMKKLLSLLLALVMLFSFTACELDQETVDLAADVAIALLEEAVEEQAPTPEEIPEAIPTPVEVADPPEAPHAGEAEKLSDSSPECTSFRRIPVSFFP